MATSVDANV